MITILTKKETVFDEILSHIASLLVRRMNRDYLLENFTLEEIDYFAKCVVVALNSNDNLSTRQSITELITNLLMPLIPREVPNNNDDDEDEKII